MLSRLAVESGLFPVFEAEHGVVTSVKKIRRRASVEDYLRLQKRFDHLFGSNGRNDLLEQLQAIAEENIRLYGLLEE